MYVPIKIDEGLYFEGKLDTEALLTVMTKKVPEPAGYDYNQLIIQCTARELVMAGTLLMISNEDMSEADGMEQSS